MTIKSGFSKDLSSIIKVIGVGGGGSNAVNHMYEQGIKGVDFIVSNTDQQALEMSPVPNKIQLGSSLTKGLGAAAIPEIGKKAALETIEEIKEILNNNTKMVFITAGMGGGTGTGGAPVIAQAAKEMGILTVGIITIPFSFEGKKRKQQAEAGLIEMRKYVDTLLVICNDRLRDLYRDLKLSEAFSRADDILTVAAKGISEIITVSGYINVDFNEVNTVMRNSGVAVMGTGIAEGEDRALKAIKAALTSPLLNENDIADAQNILLYISSGKDEITMDEISKITDYIQQSAGFSVKIIWINGHQEELGSKISVTLIATGFNKINSQEITQETDTKKFSNGSKEIADKNQSKRISNLREMCQKIKNQEGLREIEKTPAYIRRQFQFDKPSAEEFEEINVTNEQDSNLNENVGNIKKNKLDKELVFKEDQIKSSHNKKESIKKTASAKRVVPTKKAAPAKNLVIKKNIAKTATKPESVKTRCKKELNEINSKINTPQSDNVHFSLSCPSIVNPGQSFIIDIWAHLEHQREEIIRRIKEVNLQNSAPIVTRSKGPFKIDRGSLLFVKISIQDLKIDDNNETILWDGDIANADFTAIVPQEVSVGIKTGNVRIYCQNGTMIARVPLQIFVKETSEISLPTLYQIPCLRKAFASYASADRDEVIGRIQGMQKIMPDLNVFLDVVNLRSGVDWQKKIESIIPENDVFYLFWSKAAKESSFVEKEWKFALASKGIDFIDPVPLISPERVPPPEELAKKHFNDWILAYKRQLA